MASPAEARHRDLVRDARRALEQLSAVERRCLEHPPYRLAHQYDPRAARYTIRVHVTGPLPAELSTLAGQVVRDGRAALDAIATALSSGGSPAGGRPIRFPIHQSLPEFAQRSRRAIAGMPDVAQATIEELQPYHTFGGFHKDSLWLLRELDAVDALALAAGALRDDSALGVNTQRHVEITGPLRVVPGAFEDGGVVVDVAATVAGRDPKLDLYLRPVYQTAFARQGPARGAPVIATLTAILDRVEKVIAALEPAIPA